MSGARRSMGLNAVLTAYCRVWRRQKSARRALQPFQKLFSCPIRITGQRVVFLRRHRAPDVSARDDKEGSFLVPVSSRDGAFKYRTGPSGQLNRGARLRNRREADALRESHVAVIDALVRRVRRANGDGCNSHSRFDVHCTILSDAVVCPPLAERFPDLPARYARRCGRSGRPSAWAGVFQPAQTNSPPLT